MTLAVRAITAALRLALSRDARAFRAKLHDPRAAQDELLAELLVRTASTEYGRAHHLDPRDDYESFEQKLPIVTYDDLEPWLGRELTDEPVLFYEPTSGSTAATKRIPYTESLRASFQRMFTLWMHDVLAHGPRLETGKLFISISPREQSTDLDYLDAPLNFLLRRFLVLPPSAAQVTDPTQYRRAVARALITGQPEVVSIWNPSYLGVLDEELGDKTLDCVKLLSCWGGGAEALRARFPNALIQPKGLLATEAPITIPLIGANGFVPLLDEVFLEFEDASHEIRRLHELAIGADYALVISQKSGLLRYRLGDRVRVTHFHRATPCLDFIGRDAVCDLVGEKLSDGFAAEVLATIRGVHGRYGVLLPDTARRRPSYLAVIDRADAAEELLARRLEQALLASHRYAEARRLGQLGPARVRIVRDAEKRTMRHFVDKGMKLGDIKPAVLIRNRDDAVALIAQFEEEHAPALQ